MVLGEDHCGLGNLRSLASMPKTVRACPLEPCGACFCYTEHDTCAPPWRSRRQKIKDQIAIERERQKKENCDDSDNVRAALIIVVMTMLMMLAMMVMMAMTMLMMVVMIMMMVVAMMVAIMMMMA